jgi:hypothetical protein
MRIWRWIKCTIGWHDWGQPIQSSPGWLKQNCRECGQLVGLWNGTE